MRMELMALIELLNVCYRIYLEILLLILRDEIFVMMKWEGRKRRKVKKETGKIKTKVKMRYPVIWHTRREASKRSSTMEIKCIHSIRREIKIFTHESDSGVELGNQKFKTHNIKNTYTCNCLSIQFP